MSIAALYAGVSGLASNANNLAIISDNISNLNTVGYKSGVASFQTLVTGSGVAASYSPGGVLGGNRPLVSKQGLIQGSASATDIAISGNGFFVVNNASDGTGSTLFTRAGSFRQDNLGNFRNTAGYYLQGWPLDREGRLPGTAGNSNTNSSSNLTSLETVNVLAATGSAAGTTSVSVSSNLKASEGIFPGASATADIDSHTGNADRPAKSIIVPGVLEGSALSGNMNSIERGDKITVSTGTGLSYTYRYGGFTYGRDVSSGANGDSGVSRAAASVDLNSTPFTTVASSNIVTVNATAHGLAEGDVITISGNTADVNGIDSSEFNKKFVVKSVTNDNAFTIEVASNAGSGTLSGGDSGLTAQFRPFGGSIMDAITDSQLLLGTIGVNNFTTPALSFTITTVTTGTVTFTYTASTPNAQLRQFNTLANLADAISAVSGLTARVSGGRLYVGSADANEAVLFANGSVIGDDSTGTVKSGIDWIRELGLKDVTTGDDRFNSLQSLSDRVRASAGLDAKVNNALTSATLDINVKNPLDTISFNDPAVAAAFSGTFAAAPFTTTSGDTEVSLAFPAPHGLKTGDLITIDASDLDGYIAPFAATSAFTTNTMTPTSVVINVADTNGLANGDTVRIDPSSLTGYPTATINGIALSNFAGDFVISSVGATSFTITVASGAGSAGTTGTTGNLIIDKLYNGIPVSDFDGRFEVTVTGPSTVSFDVATAATSGSSTGSLGLSVTPPNNTGSLLAELGLVDSLLGGTFSSQSVGPLGPKYDPGDSAKNMAGGQIIPQYTQNLRVYDSLGTGHDLQLSYIKVGVNTWAAELYAASTDEVSASYADGLLASGTLTFNGDGSLRSVSSGLSTEINVIWANGAVQSDIAFNWGTAGEPFGTAGASAIGKTDGLSQLDTSYKVNFVSQNGAAVGQLQSVTIDAEGFVIANYNNGESQKLYKLPIADFSNPDALEAVSGNAFFQTTASGQASLKEANTNGAGKLQASALEGSNVELAEQLTALIIAQRAYQANTKLITAADTLLQELNNTIRG